MTKPVLYTYFRSSCAFRVRIALNVKRIDCNYHAVNIKPGKDEQFLESYTALNPQARVPLWIDDEVEISQSTAIIEYLEERYPTPALLPKNLAHRAALRQIANIISCDIQPLNNLAPLNYLKAHHIENGDTSAWYAHWIREGFSSIEKRLPSLQHLFTDEINYADIFLVPQVWNALRFKVPMDSYPALYNRYQQLIKQAEVIAAMPENQDDACE